MGYEIRRVTPPFPRDFGPTDIELWRSVSGYTMTSPEAVFVLADSVRYIVATGVEGAIVECGVWRGGGMMAAAKTLIEVGEADIELFLFDTFGGMTAPTERDVHWTGPTAEQLLRQDVDRDASTVWARAALDDVRGALSQVSYPSSRIHYVVGRVEETIPGSAPDRIALLRLDTDWYESTKHELVHLYPRLSPGGILIVDDYSWWRGAREATDEYFAENPPAPFLIRIDDGGRRVAVKP